MCRDLQYWTKRAQEYGERSVMDFDPKRGSYDQELRVLAFHRAMRLGKDMKVLDVGCGNGSWSIMLAKAGCKVTGIDFVESLINTAKHNAMKAGVAVDFTTESIETYERDRQVYDLIITVTVLQHITCNNRLARALSNIRALLKPRGQFLTIEYMPRKLSRKSQSSDYMVLRQRDEWLRLFREAGFHVARELGVRIIGFRLYNLCKCDLALDLSLVVDKFLTAIPIISEKYSDTTLVVLNTNKNSPGG